MGSGCGEPAVPLPPPAKGPPDSELEPFQAPPIPGGWEVEPPPPPPPIQH